MKSHLIIPNLSQPDNSFIELQGLTKTERLCYTPCVFKLKGGIIQYVGVGYKVAPGYGA